MNGKRKNGTERERGEHCDFPTAKDDERAVKGLPFQKLKKLQEN